MENNYSNSDLQEVVQLKNSIITNQTKRIKMLEDKLDEVRHKYFDLKRYISFRYISK